jgi:hypothetical protein
MVRLQPITPPDAEPVGLMAQRAFTRPPLCTKPRWRGRITTENIVRVLWRHEAPLVRAYKYPDAGYAHQNLDR